MSRFARMTLFITGLAGLAATLPAWANDRPFQVARTAILEDDEQVWSFESWVQRFGSVRGVSIEPECTFSDGTSVQVELARFVDRNGSETGHEAEVEFKKIFNNIARDGWGWAVSGTLAAERTNDTGRTVSSIGLKLPFSIQLGEGGGYLHLNPGITKASNTRRAWSSSAGIEREVFKRTVLFAELSREGEVDFAQVGARHWVRRDKLAIDLSVQQQGTEGRRSSGFIRGPGWYDL